MGKDKKDNSKKTPAEVKVAAEAAKTGTGKKADDAKKPAPKAK